jgi:hypothetical protein
MVEMDFESEAARISKINPAAIINITIEELWKDAYKALKRGDYSSWNRVLDCIWLILGGDVSPGDDDDKRYRQIEMRIGDTGALSHKKQGFEIIPDDEAKTMAIQYYLLKEKSLFLRRLQNKQGKGTAYDDGLDDYMD